MSAIATEASPTVFTDGLGPLQRLERAQADPNTIEIVCQRVIDGESLGQIAKSLGLPKLKFIKWIGEEFGAEYESALRMSADERAHELSEIADNCDPDAVNKAKLRTEVRRWQASRWDKSRYGEHTKVEHSGNVSLIALLSSLPSGEESPAQVIEHAAQTSLPIPVQATDATV